jgi:hypothetical protein
LKTANVEVNRRAEGTSELNRRLGDGSKGDWAFARCGAAGDYGWGLAGKQARRGACLRLSTKVKQQASNREALPERAEVERQEPERGLTWRSDALHGFIAQRRCGLTDYP